MLNRLKNISLFSLLLVSISFIQGADPAPTNSTGVPPQTTAANAEPDTGKAALDYLFNRKPQDGTAAKGAADSMNLVGGRLTAADAFGKRGFDDPVLQARFEKFLSTPEKNIDQVKAYHEKLDKVEKLLRAKKSIEAWKALYETSEYADLDAGVSLELANRVESFWNLDKATANAERKNAELKKTVEQASWNTDVMSDSLRDKEIEFQKKSQNQGVKTGKENSKNSPFDEAKKMAEINQAGGSSGAQTESAQGSAGSNLIGKLQLTEEYLKALEAKAKIKLNEVKLEKLDSQIRTNFEEYIKTLFGSRRYLHVVLAANFYRTLFEDSDYPVEIANQVNASLEIIRESNSAIEAFEHKINGNALTNATQRLQEAFATFELSPRLAGISLDKKDRISSYLTQLSAMQNLIEARDFGKLAEDLDTLKKASTDFDAAKANALVNGVKLESQMRLGKAKLAAQQGDQKLAMEEFQAAAQAWPANPELKNAASTFFESQDIKTQSTVEFDRLVADQDYRGIYDKQLLFLPSIKGDKNREDQLKKAFEKVKLAETSSEKASLLMANGDIYGAWETVDKAVKEWPDDKKLNRLLAELSVKSAEFVSAVNKAKEAESQGDLGYSLTWYLNAQKQYPSSSQANEAIDRLSKKILTVKNSN